MLSEKEVREILDDVVVDGDRASLISKNLVKEIAVTDGAVSLVIADTGLGPEGQQLIKDTVGEAFTADKNIKKFDIAFKETKPAEMNRAKNMIVVMSGKGGVGKSVVSGLLAVDLRRKGRRVGILDADIVGPSVPRMFGLAGKLRGYGQALLPGETKTGIEVVSMNLLLENECDPVIWRGPIISGAIKQFWEETIWGELDDLIIDLPPGTTDASLTVLQSLPVTGILIVTTPQGLVEMIVNKAVNMVKEMDKPVIGIIENMSYLLVPGTGQKVEIFGHSRAEEISKEIDVPFLGRLPIDPEIARLSDAGNIEDYKSPAFDAIVDTVVQKLNE